MASVREVSRVIQDYVRNESDLRYIKFDKIEERDFCAYISDELTSKFQQGFGGDYESSITFRFSNGVGLEAEVYISNRKAQRIGANLLPVLRSLTSGFDVEIFTTRYIPNQSGMSFTLTTQISDANDAMLNVAILGTLVAAACEQLARY